MTKKIIFLLLLGCCVFVSARENYGQKVVTAAQVNGTWHETSSKVKGVSTEFRIWALGGQKLQIEFYANNALEKFSNFETGTATIEGTTATFKLSGTPIDDQNPCVMTLKFGGGDKLTVVENGVCGWGKGVGSDGTYKKLSSRKPKFDEQ